jgi:hypothetical protein
VSPEGYAILGYVLGIGLPLAYAIRLWLALLKLDRQTRSTAEDVESTKRSA